MEVKSKYIPDGVRSVQIQYSTQQLEPSSATSVLNPGDSFRIVFRQSDITSSIDIANTRLNLTLNINRAGFLGAVSFPVVCSDICNIFELQSIVWGGVQLTHSRGQQGDSLMRKILRMLGSSRYDQITETISQGLDFQTPFQQSADPQSATDGVYKFHQQRKFNQQRYIPMLERSRLESEVIKHYTINQGANLTIIPSFVPKNADRPENRYSIPLGELCPELQDLKVVDRMLLSGSGLELNFVISQPKFALQLVPRDGDSVEIAPGVANINFSATSWQNTDTFSIKNCFLSIPQHLKSIVDGPSSISQMIPKSYMTFAHNQQQVSQGAANLNYQWSIGHSTYCMGVVVCFAPKDLNTIGSGISMNLSVTPYAEFNASELKKISCNYMYKMPFTEVSIQVGSDSYGAQQGPPTANRELNSWLQAKEHVLQLFGMELLTTFERYNTIDFCHFIPIHKQLTSGELFQFYMTSKFQGDANVLVGANDLQAHFFTILVNTLSVDGNSVKVE